MKQLHNEDISKLWNMVFNISLNMLHNTIDAEDATQAVFEKILKKHSTFKGESKFCTWVYRIAYNHLIDIKKKRFNDEISFEQFENDVQSYEPYKNELGLTREEEKIYAEEVKVGCTLAMLQCLDPENRLIYILGKIFNFTGNQAAEICDIEPATYRKKLSRANDKIRNFVGKNCGLINPDAFCQCRKRILIAKTRGRIDPDHPTYTNQNLRIKSYIQEMDNIDEESKIFQGNPFFDKSQIPGNQEFIARLKNKFRILQESEPTLFDNEI